MIRSRVQPLPRRNYPTNTPSAPAPDFENEDLDTDSEEPEDIFGAFFPYLFPDDTPSFHGDPGQHLLYSSTRYGDLDIMVPTYPGSSEKRSVEAAAGPKTNDPVNHVEEGRKLFAHFLWSAAMVVAEGIEEADTPTAPGETETEFKKEAKQIWNVKGESVLELGAGK